MAILASAGCAMPELFKFTKEDFPKAGPRNPVIRILGLWEPAEGMAMNKSSRGFSAQILFFSHKSDLAAQVDGDVRIYVFDDQGTQEEQAVPFQECNYTAEAWNSHMGVGPLGATYGVFVPYTRTGNHEAKCSLRIRYTPKGGQPFYSGMVNVVLPGSKRPRNKAAANEEVDDPTANLPEAADEAFNSFHQNVSNRQPPHAKGTSTTIPTLPDVQEQLQAQQRVPAAELTTKERRRIMREAAAQLASRKEASRVSLAGHEEPEPETAATEQNEAPTNAGQVHHADAEESLDAEGDDESPAPAKLPTKPAKRRVLDEDE